MAQPKLVDVTDLKIERPEREKLSQKESLERMAAFSERKEAFVAAIRKSQD